MEEQKGSRTDPCLVNICNLKLEYEQANDENGKSTKHGNEPMTHLAVPLIYFPFEKPLQLFKSQHLFFLDGCQKHPKSACTQTSIMRCSQNPSFD